MSSCCVIVPAYGEEAHIRAVVEGIRRYCPDVVVVDDGSTDRTAEEAGEAGAVVLKHEDNLGKGAALDTGFNYARQQGFDAVISMDADGQHAPQDLRGFLERFGEGDFRVLVGNRMSDPVGMPLVRRLTNRFMSWLLSRRMGQRVPDTQCGFRLYGLDVVPAGVTESGRFAVESEILMRLSDRGVRIGSVPIRIIYGDEKSKIHPLRDTVRFCRMLMRYRKEDLSRLGSGETRVG